MAPRHDLVVDATPKNVGFFKVEIDIYMLLSQGPSYTNVMGLLIGVRNERDYDRNDIRQDWCHWFRGWWLMLRLNHSVWLIDFCEVSYASLFCFGCCS